MAEGNISTGDQSVAGCPLDPVMRFFALKWLVHIVWLLGRRHSLRFTELQRDLPGDVSAKVLSHRLKELEKLAIVVRDDKGVSPPHVAYHLAPQGRVLDEFLVAIELLAQRLPLPDIPPPSTDV